MIVHGHTAMLEGCITRLLCIYVEHTKIPLPFSYSFPPFFFFPSHHHHHLPTFLLFPCSLFFTQLKALSTSAFVRTCMARDAAKSARALAFAFRSCQTWGCEGKIDCSAQTTKRIPTLQPVRSCWVSHGSNVWVTAPFTIPVM